MAEFLIVALAVWRVTFALTREEGPWRVFVRLRRAAGAGVVGRALQCFYCTSLWVALPATLYLERSAARASVVWFALSGAAALLQRGTERTAQAIPLDDRVPDRPPASPAPLSATESPDVRLQ